MEIERLSNHTLCALVDLVLELWPDCSFDEELASYTHLLVSSTEACYLAKAGEEPVGFVHVSTRTDYVEGAEASPVAYIEGIYVKPAFQKQGIAKKLIRVAEDWARQKGLTQIASDTEITNRTSVYFHKKVGFVEVERLVCFIKDLS
jgi:aminoglycoside 6'-N-acetyltransferase I